jgi:hypothetical protein
LVGVHDRNRYPDGEQVALAVLDPFLHLAAGAVKLLVEEAAVRLGFLEGGDDEARVGLASCPFRLADHPSPARPVKRGVAEVLEAAAGPAGCGRLRLGLQKLDGDLLDSYNTQRLHWLTHGGIERSRYRGGMVKEAGRVMA